MFTFFPWLPWFRVALLAKLFSTFKGFRLAFATALDLIFL